MKKKALAVLRTDIGRRKTNMMKINEYFSYDKVKDVSYKNICQGIYSGSDYDSDKSIHYTEDHGVDYHKNDKTKVKNKIK